MEVERLVLIGLIVVIFGATVNDGLKLPSYLKGCSSHDPKLNECALKSARDLFKTNIPATGDRKYSVPSLDPLTITELKIDQQGLLLEYQNMKLYGLKDIDIKGVWIDLKHLKAKYDFVVPELKIVSNYLIKGKLLVVSLSGNGATNITMTNVMGSMSHDFTKTTKKNGKVHFIVDNGFLESELGGFKTTMTGLFNGDKRLGDHLNLFLNENWKEVVKEIKPSFNAALAKVADQVFNNLAAVVPYNDLFPEPI